MNLDEDTLTSVGPQTPALFGRKLGTAFRVTWRRESRLQFSNPGPSACCESTAENEVLMPRIFRLTRFALWVLKLFHDHELYSS